MDKFEIGVSLGLGVLFGFLSFHAYSKFNEHFNEMEQKL